jgi:hypothetical protein
MSEIKFACPHCSQHIACGDIYCGEQVSCPGCAKELFVPQLAAFIPLQAGNMTISRPVAFKERPPGRAAGFDLWAEKDWDHNATELGVVKSSSLLPLWILLLAPFAAALVMLMHRARLASIELLFVLCALAAGFYMAKIKNKSGAEQVVMGLIYSIAAIFCYGIIGFGLLFVGCLVVLGSSVNTR